LPLRQPISATLHRWHMTYIALGLWLCRWACQNLGCSCRPQCPVKLLGTMGRPTAYHARPSQPGRAPSSQHTHEQPPSAQATWAAVGQSTPTPYTHHSSKRTPTYSPVCPQVIYVPSAGCCCSSSHTPGRWGQGAGHTTRPSTAACLHLCQQLRCSLPWYN
jgi:hypothetical protein